MQGKTRVIALDLRAYFDQCAALSAAREGADGYRCKGDEITEPDPEVDWEERSPARRVISPLLSNVYLMRWTKMLEKGDSHDAARKSIPSTIRGFADDM